MPMPPAQLWALAGPMSPWIWRNMVILSWNAWRDQMMWALNDSLETFDNNVDYFFSPLLMRSIWVHTLVEVSMVRIPDAIQWDPAMWPTSRRWLIPMCRPSTSSVHRSAAIPLSQFPTIQLICPCCRTNPCTTSPSRISICSSRPLLWEPVSICQYDRSVHLQH